MQITGAQIIIRFLESQGVQVVAGIPGGAVLPLYDALANSPIRHVLAGHEQGAGFIAQGMARQSGKPAVCLVSSGPGVLNLLTALADAHADSIPVVAICAQVARHLIGTDAFQEVDAFTLSLPITKHSWQVRSAAELPAVLEQAFQVAGGGRMGPVLLDIPKDVLTETCELQDWPTISSPVAQPKPDMPPGQITQAVRLLAEAQRPIIYAGGGVMAAWRQRSQFDPAQALADLAERAGMPVCESFMGLGLLPSDHPLCLGMIGMHGAPYANQAMDEADLVLAIGVRFDDRATGRLADFCPAATIIHVDIDAAELGKLVRPDLSIRADAGEFLAAIAHQVPANPRWEWRRQVAELRRLFPMPAVSGVDYPNNGAFPVVELLRLVRHSIGPRGIITTDVGQHQMWAAQHYPFAAPNTLLSSGGMGTMGFGLPAAIGAALTSGQRVVCLTGDGSILMNIQELATLAHLRLPVTMVVFNNRNLGLVRQQQSLFYGQRYQASGLGTGLDFVQIARGFGIKAMGPFAQGDGAALAAALQSGAGPLLLDVTIDPDAMVLPMVAPGAPNCLRPNPKRSIMRHGLVQPHIHQTISAKAYSPA